MRIEQQKLSGKLKNAPTDASIVCRNERHTRNNGSHWREYGMRYDNRNDANIYGIYRQH